MLGAQAQAASQPTSDLGARVGQRASYRLKGLLRGQRSKGQGGAYPLPCLCLVPKDAKQLRDRLGLAALHPTLEALTCVALVVGGERVLDEIAGDLGARRGFDGVEGDVNHNGVDGPPLNGMSGNLSGNSISCNFSSLFRGYSVS